MEFRTRPCRYIFVFSFFWKFWTTEIKRVFCKCEKNWGNTSYLQIRQKDNHHVRIVLEDVMLAHRLQSIIWVPKSRSWNFKLFFSEKKGVLRLFFFKTVFYLSRCHQPVGLGCPTVFWDPATTFFADRTIKIWMMRWIQNVKITLVYKSEMVE